MKVTTSRLIALALAGSVLTGPLMANAALAATKKPVSAKAAPAPDDALTRAAAQTHAGEIFDRLDVNHDGVVNAADGKARRDARLGAMFDRLDANHDGSVTRAEFIAAHEDRGGPDGPGGNPPPPGAGRGPDRGPEHGPDRGPDDRAGMIAHSPMVFAILRQADPQHTGSVTRDAFIAAELKRFDEADANHDGKVTQDEVRAARHDHGWGPRHGGFRDGGPRGGDWRHDGGPRDGGPDHGPRHPPRDGDMPPPPPPASPPAPDAAK